MRLLNVEILAGNAARQWLLIEVSKDRRVEALLPDLSKRGQQRRRCLYRQFYGWSKSNWNKFSIYFLLFL